MCISGLVWGATCNTPSSSFTYVSGTVINPTAVQTNENNLYSYVQQGVCNYQAGSITTAAISSTAGITYSQLNLTGGIVPSDINTTTTTSIYTFQNITVPFATTLQGTLSLNGSQGTSGQVLVSQGTGTNASWGAIPYIKLSNTQASGTGGGAATVGSWLIIPINTVDIDTGSNVVSNSSSSGFVLVAGTYQIDATSPFFVSAAASTRLQNITDSTTVLTGESVSSIAVDVTANSRLSGRFTIAASKALELQYQVGSNNSSSASLLGQPSGFGPEVYAQIILRKIG